MMETGRSFSLVKGGGLVLLLVLLLSLAGGIVGATPRQAAGIYPPATVAHYFYDFPDGNMYVYDMDNNFALVYSTALPISQRIVGVAASATTKMLYLSYGTPNGPGSASGILAYDLVKNAVAWQKSYTIGADQLALTPDGKTIYLPDGEHSPDGTWNIINAADGTLTGSLTAGIGPHDGLVSTNGQHLYMGGLGTNALYEASTATNTVIQTMGPTMGGIRPFVVNGSETYAFMNEQGFVGFQVANIQTGQIVYTVTPPGFTGTYSHGISLSPDESQLYLMDAPNNMVHVFSMAGFPGAPPSDIKDIPLNSMAGNESPCVTDCAREGWLLHSSDGKYVFSADSGDILNTATMTPLVRDTSSSSTVYNTLSNTRKMLEIDWTLQPGFTTTHFGLGYNLTPPSGTPTPTPTPLPTNTPTPTPTPGTVIAQDTFVRPNQTLWGTASDGHVWGGDANSMSIFSIANNAGVVGGTGNTTDSAVLGPQATNAEDYVTGSLSTFTNANFGDVLRFTDGNNWYKAYINGSSLVIQKKVNGSTTLIGQVSFTASVNTSYSIHFRVVGTTLTANAWPSSGSEPPGWMLSVSDSTFVSGYCGIRILTQSGSATMTTFKAMSL